MKRFRQKFKSIDLGPKNDPLPRIWSKQEFFSEKGLLHFLVFIESSLHAKNKTKQKY